MRTLDISPVTLEATRRLLLQPKTALAPANGPQNGTPLPKYRDLTLKDPHTNQIVAYFDPNTLTEEFEYPEQVQVSWTSGFPLVKGIPFWERLPNEREDFYGVFSHFRDQAAPRLLYKTANFFEIDPKTLEIIAELWIWYPRVEQFDLYNNQLLEANKTREIRVLEDEHSKAARKMFEKAMRALEQVDDSDITPGQAVEIIKTAAQIERVSKGLPKDEPLDHKNKNQNGGGNLNINAPGQKIQVIMQKDWQSA